MSENPEPWSQNGASPLAARKSDVYAEAHQSPTMNLMVAETKLSRPRLSSRLVDDPSRFLNLDRSAGVPFTLVSAPAGFGKTTLVTQWLEHRKPVHAWLTLDHRDNAPSLFWNSISAALARVDDRFALRESTLLTALEPGASVDPVAILVNRLADYARTWQAPQRLYLVLDDFHVVRRPELLDQVRRFIDFAPGLLRILCISRSDPPIRVAQLLARDQMVKLGPEALCFDLETTRRFVRSRRADVEDSAIVRLHERTGGWPAALQLSTLSSTLAGNNGGPRDPEKTDALAAYLLEEVFGELEPTLQQFLMDMSLLPLFSADIADQARGDNDASRQILALREHNLLLQRYGSGPGWFRLHDLLAEWLRARVEQDERTRGIRVAAARAFQDRGLINEALDLFLAEQSFEEAESLVPALLQGDDLAGHRDLAERFPASLRRISPALTLLEALFTFLEGAYQETMELIEDTVRILEQRPVPEADTLRFITLLLTCPAARFTGRKAAARSSIRQVSEQLRLSNRSLRNWGLYTLGIDAFIDAELDSAQGLLTRALEGALSGADSHCALRCLTVLIPVLIHRGRVNEAWLCFNRSYQRLTDLPPVRDQAAMLAYLEGLLALESHELDRAGACFEEASQLERERMNLLDRVYLAFERFRFGMITGNEPQWRASLECIGELHQLMGGGDWTYNIPRPAALEAMALMKSGDAALLITWATMAGEDETPSHFGALHDRLLRVVGRVLVGVAVDEELQQLKQEAASGGVQLLVCHLGLVELLIEAYRDNNLPGAAKQLASLLARWVPEGLLRPFLDTDAQLDPVLVECQRLGLAPREVNRVMQLRRGPLPSVPGEGVSGTGQGDGGTLPESLSQRECHVLQLLSKGMSNKGMSHQLGITVATVKSHLGNIYGKLQVDNRVRAVARAREIGLLDQ